jgi:hypothetical protein
MLFYGSLFFVWKIKLTELNHPLIIRQKVFFFLPAESVGQNYTTRDTPCCNGEEPVTTRNLSKNLQNKGEGELIIWYNH